MRTEEIPKEWEKVTIENTCDILDSKRIPLNSEERYSMKGRIPYYGANGIVDYINDYLFDDDLLLVAEDGGHFDEFYYRPIAYRISGKAWVNNHAHVLKVKDSYCLDFIFYSLEHKNIIPIIQGGTRSKLNQSELRTIPIFCPKSIKVQEKIAAILQSVDTTIVKTKGIIEKYQMMKQGMIHDLFLKGISKDGSLRSKDVNLFNSSPIGYIPVEWDVNVIESLASITTGNKDTQDRVLNGEYPFFVRSQTIERINSYSYDCEGILTAGDGVGVGKVFHYFNGKFDFHQRVYLIHNFKPKIDGKFMFYHFKNKFIDEVSKYSAKTTVDSVRYHMIANMNIPVPNDIHEQEHIVRILSSLDEKIESEQSNLEKLIKLKSGLMHDLLTGRVPVKVKEAG